MLCHSLHPSLQLSAHLFTCNVTLGCNNSTFSFKWNVCRQRQGHALCLQLQMLGPPKAASLRSSGPQTGKCRKRCFQIVRGNKQACEWLPGWSLLGTWKWDEEETVSVWQLLGTWCSAGVFHVYCFISLYFFNYLKYTFMYGVGSRTTCKLEGTCGNPILSFHHVDSRARNQDW